MAKYALIKWKDGYQEVASLEEETTGILRYYVIERVEQFGRLAFDSKAKYPGLKIISRKPDQIESITFAEDGHSKVFNLNPKEDKSEGGRTDHHYEIKEVSEKGTEEIVSELKQVLNKLGLDPKSAKEEDLEKIRKAMRLSCLETQSEILGFIKTLLEKCI